MFGQAGVINRDYEGEIRNVGDSVKINAIGSITVGSYTKNSDINDPEDITGAGTTLLIDQANYFNFQVDDIDRVQARPDVMSEAMREAGYALKDELDGDLAALWSQVSADNFIGTNGSPKTDMGTAGYPLNYLLQLATILDQNNVPTDGRWVIIPPWYKELLLKGDTRILNPGTPQAEMRLANGNIGHIAGFDWHNVVNTSDDNYKIMSGPSDGVDVGGADRQGRIMEKRLRTRSRACTCVRLQGHSYRRWPCCATAEVEMLMQRC